MTEGNKKKAEGACLCGKVKVHAESLDTNMGACHCGMCRRWSAGPFLAVDCGTDIKFEGEQFIKVFVSSDWAERGFCSECGSHIFYRLKESQQHIMSAELFGESELNFDHQVFIDEKPKYYNFSNDTKNMTGAELFAAFSGSKD